MRYSPKTILIILLLFSSVVFLHMGSCKKIDLTRIAMVSTDPVENITAYSVKANGVVIDMGSSNTDHGFCWAKNANPDINDQKSSAGTSSSTGPFNMTITNLEKNTDYFIRSYIQDDAGINYGELQSFRTLGQTIDEWIKYDNGSNYTHIGFPDGGDFDVAIRFRKEDLQAYAGGQITKVRFHPGTGAPTEYYVTIWEGDDSPQLAIIEKVDNFNTEDWTEYTLDEFHTINTQQDLWIGYWIVGSPTNSFPAGCDEGPALAGFGDMISLDDGETWASLSQANPDLDYNWNIQAFVMNSKGENIKLERSKTVDKPSSGQSQNALFLETAIQSNNPTHN